MNIPALCIFVGFGNQIVDYFYHLVENVKAFLPEIIQLRLDIPRKQLFLQEAITEKDILGSSADGVLKLNSMRRICNDLQKCTLCNVNQYFRHVAKD